MGKRKNLTVGRKIVKWIGIVLGGLIALVAVIALCLHLFTPLVFRDFFGNADKEYLIPGLGNGLVPQGYAYVPEHDVYLQCGYMTDGRAVFTPALALSVTNKVQGFTRTPGGFALSTSYGLGISHIYFHEDVTKGEADSSIRVNSTDVPVYFLDDDSLTRDLSAPPMTEEIFVKDGRLYVLPESACNKYIFGNLIHGRHVYSYELK
jgi:hypothetical protein